MILHIKNVSGEAVSIPLGPNLLPQEETDMVVDYSVSDMMWAIEIFGLDVETIGGLTREIRDQLDVGTVILNLYLKGLITVTTR